MNRDPIMLSGRSRGISLEVALALCRLGVTLPRKLPPPPTEATLARLYDEAKREDWNRVVAARKAAKQARKATR